MICGVCSVCGVSQSPVREYFSVSWCGVPLHSEKELWMPIADSASKSASGFKAAAGTAVVSFDYKSGLGAEKQLRVLSPVRCM